MGCDARKAKSFGKEKPMKRQGKWAPEILSVVAGVVVALVLGAAPGRAAHAAAEPFSQAQVFFEYNSAEGNMGLQLFFDGEWTEVEIRDPKGRPIFETETQGKLRRVGGAEVRFESVEPFFDPNDPEPPFFKKFPAGLYTFRGTTVDGEKLKSTVALSHQLPAAPVLVVPATVGDIEWTWTQGMSDPFQADLAGFQVIVELVVDDKVVRALTIELPPGTTAFRIPPEFLPAPPGAEVLFEVLATADNGNRTIAQGVLP
jgi:hypothetical protein